MTRYSHVASIALAVLSPLACNDASDDQAKANKAQTETNGDINARLRDDYGSKTTKNLGELDRKVGVLEMRSTAGKTKAQVEVDERLAQIHAKRVQFDADLKTSQSAPEGSWDSQKAHLDQELVELQALVDKPTPAEVSARSN